MKKDINVKLIVIGIAFLFLGGGIAPIISGNQTNQKQMKNTSNEPPGNNPGAMGAESSISLSFDFDTPNIETVNLFDQNYSIVNVHGTSNIFFPGEPIIPMKKVNVLLPPGGKIINVNFTGESNIMPVKYEILPADPPAFEDEGKLYEDLLDEIYKNQQTYESSDFEIGKKYDIEDERDMLGFSYCILQLYPIQYIPKLNKLFYYTNMDFNIEIEEGDVLPKYRGLSHDFEIVEKSVINPLMLDLYPKNEDEPMYNYIIITTPNLYDVYKNLRDYKEEFTTVKIVNKSDIIDDTILNEIPPAFSVDGTWGDCGNNVFIDDTDTIADSEKYLFDSDSARIRNFIRFAHQVWGTSYVLLGGDDRPNWPDEEIPARGLWGNANAFLMGVMGGMKKADIRGDIYYAVLDGTFNHNRQGVHADHWGERVYNGLNLFGQPKKTSGGADGPDRNGDGKPDDLHLEPDVYVGRVAISSNTLNYEDKINNFIDKVKSFERSIRPKAVTVHSQDRGSGILVAEGCADIVEDYENENGEDWDISRLYQGYNENVYKSEWINAFRDEDLIIQHAGHGSGGIADDFPVRYRLDVIYGANEEFERYNISDINNSQYDNFYPIHTSSSCNIGRYYYKNYEIWNLSYTIVDEFLCNEDGASAMMANVDKGWGRLNNNYPGYSGEFVISQFSEIFDVEREHLGVAFHESKNKTMFLSSDNYKPPNSFQTWGVYDWLEYSFNLFGDPEMSIWEPRNSKPTACIYGPNTGYVDTNYIFDGSCSSDPEGESLNYEWDLDNDGLYGTEDDPDEPTGITTTNSWSLEGTYTIGLRVTDDGGNTNPTEQKSNTTTHTISIQDMYYPPNPVIDAPSNGTINEVITFDASASEDPDGGDITLYEWDWTSDGYYDNSSTDPVITHQYNSLDIYQITLRVTDDESETNTTTHEIEIINADPTPVIDAPFNGIINEVITFDASASEDPDGGDITLYEWDWTSDGYYDNSSTDPVITHQYSNHGIKTVTLRVTDDESETNTTTHDIIILAPPVSDADGPYEGIIGSSVFFDSTGSYDPDGYIAEWAWDFGDGNISYEDNPSHIYENSGIYAVTLTVWDDDGLNDIDTTTVTIEIGEPPIADPNGPYFGTVNETIQFDGTGSYDLDGYIEEYYWDFGDGENASGPTPTHSYLSANEYTVILWVRDNDNVWKANSTTVTIAEQQPAIWVDDDAPNDWYDLTHVPSIQTGVNRVAEKGTVFVYEGTYHENVVIDKELTLTKDPSVNTTSLPTIDSPYTSLDCISIDAYGVVINGFELKNGANGIHIISDKNGGSDMIGTVIKHCNICSNSNAGLLVDEVINDIVDARYNYWGHYLGPSGGYVDFVTGRIADNGDPYAQQIVGPENLIIFDPCVGIYARASASKTSALVGDPIVFDAFDSSVIRIDGSTDSNMKYLWSYDDGFYSMEEETGHIFNAPGTYNVILRVGGNDGIPGQDHMFDFDYMTITISEPGQPLTANADANNFGGYEGSMEVNIQFYGAATGGVPPYTYKWNFGDDSSSVSGQNPTHTYSESGTYIVTLTVTDKKKNTATDTTITTIYGPDELLADAGGPYTSLIDEAIYFSGSATGGVEPYTYKWNFGDDTPEIMGQNPVHIYAEIGTYTAIITVTDSNGKNDEDTVKITVCGGDEEARIENIQGGFGVKATIYASNMPVTWVISINGNSVFGTTSSTGTIDANTAETVRLPYVLGFGNIKITVRANDIIKNRIAFMVGPFVFAVKEV